VAFRTLRRVLRLASAATQMPETCYSTVPQAISALRAKLSDAKDDQGILIDGNPNLTPDDSESITFPRTARQVCHWDTPCVLVIARTTWIHIRPQTS